MARSKAIICDLDGSLAIIGERSPYDASKCDLLDSPNKPVVECVRVMAMAGYEVVFVSGREAKDREPTERFIRNCLPSLDYELYMRKTGDNRKDSIVKRELYDGFIADRFDVLLVLDDRDSVVEMWRKELGLTCFQVNYGAF